MLFLVPILLGFSSHSNAQHKGQSVFSIGLGFPLKGLCSFSYKYFPADYYAIELFAGGAPGYMDYGVSLQHFFDNRHPNTFVQLEVGKMMVGGEGMGELEVIGKEFAQKDTFVTKGISTWGIGMGLGREFISKKNAYFFSIGPSYILSQKLRQFNYLKNEKRETFSDSLKWSGFFEAGGNIPAPSN
ncbi:MAG TPA: hypothetical protein VHO03_02710 [Ignavibacteriales bacterium]|nr:hypothetical protein [Ignavibacteriales bacterium]